MTLPVGQISLSEVNIELNRPATQVIDMNDAAVRTLAGVGGSGTVISMNNLRGKSNRVVIPLVISANTNNYNIYNSRGPTYSPGLSDITLTINPGVFVGSTSTGTAALSLPNQFSPGDTITIINQGVVIGCGGAGGAGGRAPATPGTAGGGGGTAFTTQRAVTIQNAGTFAGGGGGGGGGNFGSQVTPRPSRQGGPFTTFYGGGGGGGGAGVQGGTAGAAGTPASGLAGQAGTSTAGGAGGTATAPGVAGGAGGGRGAAGVASSAAAGAAGFYATGNPFITWQATGTRQGQVS